MFAILAEDRSDVEVLTHLVRRHLKNDGLRVKGKGYDGCSAMCRKGARDIQTWVASGASHIIVCHDADRNPPIDIKNKIMREIVAKSGFGGLVCITIPVEEIEAWMIADEKAINDVIPTFKFKGHPNPESIPDPKEWLRAKSRASNGRPLYSSTTFNPAVAKLLRLDVVAKKCLSFKTFCDWLDNPS